MNWICLNPESFGECVMGLIISAEITGSQDLLDLKLLPERTGQESNGYQTWCWAVLGGGMKIWLGICFIHIMRRRFWGCRIQSNGDGDFVAWHFKKVGMFLAKSAYKLALILKDKNRTRGNIVMLCWGRGKSGMSSGRLMSLRRFAFLRGGLQLIA